MKATIGDVLAGVFVVALVYVLVRPRSKGAEAVKLLGDVLTSLVRTVTNM